MSAPLPLRWATPLAAGAGAIHQPTRERTEERVAQGQAAEEQAEQIKLLSDSKAYEIKAINDAIASNPAYIQLQSLEALKQMSKDPAAKIYFMDSNSAQPLPLMHLGDGSR